MLPSCRDAGFAAARGVVPWNAWNARIELRTIPADVYQTAQLRGTLARSDRQMDECVGGCIVGVHGNTASMSVCNMYG